MSISIFKRVNTIGHKNFATFGNSQLNTIGYVMKLSFKNKFFMQAYEKMVIKYLKLKTLALFPIKGINEVQIPTEFTNIQ